MMFLSHSPEARRSMGLLGHAVEVEVAVRHYGANRAAAEMREARSLASRDHSLPSRPEEVLVGCETLAALAQ